MLHGDEGIKFARTVVRLPEANKFDKAESSKVASTPWDLHRRRETEVISKDKKQEQEDRMRENKIVLSRAVYIKPGDLTKFGLMRGCPKCDHQIAYGPGRTPKPHSANRRAGIMGELANTPEGRVRIAAATERLDGTVAELGNQYCGDVPQPRGEVRGCATSTRARGGRCSDRVYSL